MCNSKSSWSFSYERNHFSFQGVGSWIQLINPCMWSHNLTCENLHTLKPLTIYLLCLVSLPIQAGFSCQPQTLLYMFQPSPENGGHKGELKYVASVLSLLQRYHTTLSKYMNMAEEKAGASSKKRRDERNHSIKQYETNNFAPSKALILFHFTFYIFRFKREKEHSYM